MRNDNEQQPAPSRRRPRRGWLAAGAIYMAVGAAIVLAALGAGHALMRSRVDLVQLQGLVSNVRPWGIGLQCLAVALVGLCWRRLVEAGLRRGIVQPGEHAQVLALRPKVMAFLVAYLLLVPIGPATLLRLAS